MGHASVSEQLSERTRTKAVDGTSVIQLRSDAKKNPCLSPIPQTIKQDILTQVSNRTWKAVAPACMMRSLWWSNQVTLSFARILRFSP